MQFNPGDGSGIVDDIDFLLITGDSSYPIEDKTRNINRHYDDVVAMILESDGRWKWDDDNQTAQPKNDLNIVSTGIIAIPSSSYLTINRIEVLDVNGLWYKIIPFNEREVIDQGLSEFLKTPGRPLYYEKVGAFLNLYPKPSSANVTFTAGLRIYFQRNASYFATTDTTKSPGFAAPFHRLLSLGASIDYCIANTILLKSEFLTPIYQKMLQDCMVFYQNRGRDEQTHLGIRGESYGAERSNLNRVNSDKVAFY